MVAVIKLAGARSVQQWRSCGGAALRRCASRGWGFYRGGRGLLIGVVVRLGVGGDNGRGCACRGVMGGWREVGDDLTRGSRVLVGEGERGRGAGAGWAG